MGYPGRSQCNGGFKWDPSKKKVILAEKAGGWKDRGHRQEEERCLHHRAELGKHHLRGERKRERESQRESNRDTETEREA